MEMSAPAKAEYATERRGLIISAGTCLVVGCVAIVFVYLSSSQAIMLDGVFNIIYFLTGLFALRIARLLREPGDEEFPFGFAYFEPLVNGIKGAVTISVPARQAWRALMEMLNRAPSVKVRERIKAIVESCIRDLPIEQVFVRVVQPGRLRYVSAHVVLPEGFESKKLADLDEVRQEPGMLFRRISYALFWMWYLPQMRAGAWTRTNQRCRNSY